MADISLPGSIEPARKGPDLSGAINPVTGIIFGGVVAAVVLFVAYSIYSDVRRDWRAGRQLSAVPDALRRASDCARL